MFNFFKKKTSSQREVREAMVITVGTVFAIENIRKSNLVIENNVVYHGVARLYGDF